MEHDKLSTPIDSSGVTRRELFAGATGVVIAGVSGGVGAAEGAGARGPLGVHGAANGMELIAQINQVGPALTACGYLTLVDGLSLEQIYFPHAARTVATARFTFYGTATVASIQTLDTLIVAIANGQVEFFLRDAPGASFDVPLSFAQGQRLAADEVALQNVLNVTAPATGVTTVFGDLRRTAVHAFHLDGTRYQLGHIGLRSRLVAPGKSRRIEPPVPPTSVQFVAGNITNPR